MKLDALEARSVLRQCDFGALATLSAKLPGHPFVSHVPFALDAEVRPVLLLSGLAEHTRNLLADARVSLMATLPGPEPQSQPRLTLMGEAAPIEPPRALLDRYLRYHPEAAAWIGFGDFRFFRLRPQRVRLISGFARAGWIEAAQWSVPTLAETAEEALLAELAPALPGARLLGLDHEGCDFRDEHGGRRRLAWTPGAVDTAGLLAQARAALGGLRADGGAPR